MMRLAIQKNLIPNQLPQLAHALPNGRIGISTLRSGQAFALRAGNKHPEQHNRQSALGNNGILEIWPDQGDIVITPKR